MTTPVETAPNAKPRLRLEYLDGIRGLAALAILIGHSGGDAGTNYQGDGSLLSRLAVWAIHQLPYSYFSVSIFIVLSGYCLMIPVARSEDRHLLGGFRGYIRRRARRMLPPYYAALAFSLLLLGILSSSPNAKGLHWDTLTPLFTPGVLLSHLLLVHNLNPGWIYKINGPLWSVATEWQIYFLFPALLLPLWRRYGIVALVLGATILGQLPHFALRKALDEAHPWYIGLFAMGMAGAAINFAPQPAMHVWRERVPWGVLSAGLFGLAALAYIARPGLGSYPHWIMDIVVGGAAVCLIIFCTQRLLMGETQRAPWIVRFLEAPVTRWLGTISYSLYLIHLPILIAGMTIMRDLRLPPSETRWALWLVVLPTALLSATVFSYLFERPFLTKFDRRATARAE